MRGILSLGFGFLLGVLTAFGREVGLRFLAEDGPEATELRQLWARFAQVVKEVVPQVRGRQGRDGGR